MRFSCLLLFLFFLAVLNVHAQTGTLKGTVQDAKGNPVPYATVSLYEKDTSKAPLLEKIATDSGTFVLPVGKEIYIVKIS